MLRLSMQKKREDSSSSGDSEAEDATTITAVPTSFKVRKAKRTEGFFVVDATPIDDELSRDIFSSERGEIEEAAEGPVDKDLEKLLSTAKCGPAHEKNSGDTAGFLGKRGLKRKRKEEKEKTAGKDWFNLPATELTEERRQDLELILMRGAIDPTRHYRRNDRNVLPKYFQIGQVVDAPEDYYSSRMTKKERQKTIADELLNDFEFLDRTKSKYKELRAAEAKMKRGAFQNRGPRRKKDKGEKGKKKR